MVPWKDWLKLNTGYSAKDSISASEPSIPHPVAVRLEGALSTKEEPFSSQPLSLGGSWNDSIRAPSPVMEETVGIPAEEPLNSRWRRNSSISL